MLEQRVDAQEEEAGREAERVDSLWDWRGETKATLRTTNRLLWTVLTALCGDILVGLYLIATRH